MMIGVLLAEDFEEIEAITPIDILRRAGAEVRTYGVTGLRVRGAHGVEITADEPLANLDAAQCEALVLPGGAGYVHLDRSADCERILRAVLERGGRLAAICAAPSILGKRGLLDGRRATCFPSVEKEMGGAILTGAQVERDGPFLTAKGAGAAAEFGFALAALLVGREKAERLARDMQYDGR